MDVIREHPQHAAVSYGLYLLGITLYHRNELHNAEDKLAKCIESYYTASPMNFHNIYGKLNVSSRRQAIEQAQALGILSQR